MERRVNLVFGRDASMRGFVRFRQPGLGGPLAHTCTAQRSLFRNFAFKLCEGSFSTMKHPFQNRKKLSDQRVPKEEGAQSTLSVLWLVAVLNACPSDW